MGFQPSAKGLNIYVRQHHSANSNHADIFISRYMVADITCIFCNSVPSSWYGHGIKARKPLASAGFSLLHLPNPNQVIPMRSYIVSMCPNICSCRGCNVQLMCCNTFNHSSHYIFLLLIIFSLYHSEFQHRPYGKESNPAFFKALNTSVCDNPSNLQNVSNFGRSEWM